MKATARGGMRMVWGYAALLILLACGYAWVDAYVMDGDGTAFMDIAAGLVSGHSHLAINGYWNPGYPALLAIGRKLAHATFSSEYMVARWTNVFIFSATLFISIFFVSMLARLRQRFAPVDSVPALSERTLQLLALSLLGMSAGRELPITAVRADTLLLALLLLAAALVMRLLTEAELWIYPALGLVLGLAFLTKSFAFLPSVLLLVALFIAAVVRRKSSATQRVLPVGVIAAGALFALTAGPYIAAISHQLGHFSTGDSARMNYSFFVDQTPRWHEWFHHDLGHAGGTFVHPEEAVMSTPPVFSYAAHPVGTYPLWFAPAYWTLGLKPNVWPHGHVVRLVRCSELLVRFLLARPEPFVLLFALLLAGGARWPASRQGWSWAAMPGLWGLLMLGIYYPVDLQDRYLTAPFLLVVLTLFAVLRQSKPDEARPFSASFALVVLFAGLIAAQAVTYQLETRRENSVRGISHGRDTEVIPAGDALVAMGIQPGDNVACFGGKACYLDHYWARVAGAQILEEVESPDDQPALPYWKTLNNTAAVQAKLHELGARVLVARFPEVAAKPAGWVQLGHTEFFALPLDPSLKVSLAEDR
ncbi:hypothetical protein ACFQBQ_10960 [Granulicella cerasi]|uniref:Glycosyltransferase RgtA/B/C/D-like domain-containing protein n=1 Tax=Granulicella cerasi TaxID=741063 RepID=A0ABW1Z9C8_9BACT|nr:hypothetical protein [Granulicella cerasi]